ncbi:MAG: HAD-IA family hydrolase [Stenomitos rutilans HA7619-LM2]|jgi:putative hydrolase of the HAD superfamily|nr:HAD-IA family hydrolase [Stenomitos rutilans HA7619-LM2]
MTDECKCVHELTKYPQVIFLDAVGTLFGVKGSVGAVYADVAQQFGVEVSAAALNRSFFQSFQAAGRPAFSVTEPAALRAQELEWWLTIATTTFKQAGVWQQFSDFDEFFTALYAHFATAAPWVMYPDVKPALERWQRMGVTLGILSNFDSRIYSVLKALALEPFFASVTISTEAGAAKPDPKIFAIALQKHRCKAIAAWHIGDSFEEDYQAAKAVGIRGIWLRRK